MCESNSILPLRTLIRQAYAVNADNVRVQLLSPACWNRQIANNAIAWYAPPNETTQVRCGWCCCRYRWCSLLIFIRRCGAHRSARTIPTSQANPHTSTPHLDLCNFAASKYLVPCIGVLLTCTLAQQLQQQQKKTSTHTGTSMLGTFTIRYAVPLYACMRVCLGKKLVDSWTRRRWLGVLIRRSCSTYSVRVHNNSCFPITSSPCSSEDLR